MHQIFYILETDLKKANKKIVKVNNSKVDNQKPIMK